MNLDGVKACVFDAYGTLFDVHAAVRRHAADIGGGADALSALWRQRQLEYTWTRTLMRRHADFWRLTRDALDFAMRTHSIDDPGLRGRLLAAYAELDAYAEVPEVLRALRGRGLTTAVFSNGTPKMLRDATEAAGLGDLLDRLLSIEEVGVYKTDPSAYTLVIDRLGLARDRVLFVSSNRWDVAGGVAFGFRTAWVNRSGGPDEYLDLPPDEVLSDLRGLIE